MKLSSSILVLALAVNPSSPLFAGDPANADLGRVHEAFAPRTSIQPEVSTPRHASGVETSLRPSSAIPTAAAPASHFELPRAAVARRTPAKIAPPVWRANAASSAAGLRASSRFVPRPAAAETRTFGFAEKYQRRLAADNMVQIGRTPSLDRGATARLNRFVFRRAAVPTPSTQKAAVRAGDASSSSR